MDSDLLRNKNDPLYSWGFLLNLKKSLVNADVLGIKCISSFGVKCWTKRGFPYSILKVMVTKLFEGVTSMIRKAIRAFS